MFEAIARKHQKLELAGIVWCRTGHQSLVVAMRHKMQIGIRFIEERLIPSNFSEDGVSTEAGHPPTGYVHTSGCCGLPLMDRTTMSTRPNQDCFHLVRIFFTSNSERTVGRKSISESTQTSGISGNPHSIPQHVRFRCCTGSGPT